MSKHFFMANAKPVRRFPASPTHPFGSNGMKVTLYEAGITMVTAVACNRSREVLIFHYCSKSSSIIFCFKPRRLILINLNRDGRMRSVQKQHGVLGTLSAGA
jgi:hypothetical protein